MLDNPLPNNNIIVFLTFSMFFLHNECRMMYENYYLLWMRYGWKDDSESNRECEFNDIENILNWKHIAR